MCRGLCGAWEFIHLATGSPVLTCAFAFVVALVVATLLTPAVTALARRSGLVDVPDQVRKMHARPVPRLGGIAVVSAFLVAVAVGALNLVLADGVPFLADTKLAVGFVLGALAIAGLGIYDDLRNTNAKQKLAVQCLVAVGMWSAGFGVDLGPELEPLSFAVTLLWIVGVVNAVNLIDGLDGLASGVGLAAALAMFGVALANGQWLPCLFMAALAGGLSGFLIFNFNPARIFLGDSGSLFLGFVLALTSLWIQKGSASPALTLVPLFALGLPLLDTTLAIVRRLGRRQNPFTPDREHLHHRLLALGLSHRRAVITLYAFALVCALAALAMLDPSLVRRSIAGGAALLAGVVLVRRVGVFGVMPAAGREVLARAGAAAQVIRRSANLTAAWQEVADILPTLGCEDALLAVRHDLRSKELSWRRDLSPTASQPPQPECIAVLRPSFRRRGAVGELRVVWAAAEEAPMRAAHQQALRLLHQAISDVANRDVHLDDDASAAAGSERILGIRDYGNSSLPG